MRTDKKKKTDKPTCSMCGLCCRLFLINLNEKEYYSGKYKTIFDERETLEDFSAAKVCGANLLKQHTDESCIYLKENKCSIHENRPAVCRGFFCTGTENKYKKMRKMIESVRT